MNSSELNLSLNFLRRYLRKDSINLNKINILTDQLDLIKDYLPIVCRHFKPAQLVRVTINKRIPGVGNNRIDKIEHLKYPPEGSVTKYGRCNLIHSSVLYGAF